MPFIQRIIEPKYLSRTSLWNEDGRPRVKDDELEAVTNCTLSNALRQLASLVLVANDIFNELGDQLKAIGGRSENLKAKIKIIEDKVAGYDPKKVTVPESDICTFALLKTHYTAKNAPETGLFTASTRPQALQALYESATKTPVHLMRQMDRWRRDGHRSSRFFLCTPVLGERRRKIRTKIDIDIETGMPAAVKELRRWTSSEALGDITVTPDCLNRIQSNTTTTDGELTDGTVVSDDEGIDHKLPSPEEQLQVVALKFPAEIVAVDISGRSFDRMSLQRRSLLHGDGRIVEDTIRRRTRSRRPRNRRRNTLAGTDQKEIRDALTAGEEPSSSTNKLETETTITTTTATTVCRSKSSDLLRSSTSPKKDTSLSSTTTTDKKSHFNTLKQWGKTRYNLLMNKTTDNNNKKDDIDDFNIYETVTMKRKRNIDKQRSRSHERNPSISSSDKSSVNLPLASPLSSVMNIAVKLRESSTQRRQRRSFNNSNNTNDNNDNDDNNKDEPPHSSSGNWSASSESGRASIGSEFTSTTQPKSTTPTTTATTSNNSLNQQAPNSVNSRRRFNTNNTSTSSSVTSEGTLTPDIIHDLHEDGETSSVYSCDTEGYYTSFHMDSGLKTLKEEELPSTPLHSTSAFSHSSSNNTVLTAENEYELFGKGSTSTTTSSAGTVCTTLRASESNRSLGCPAVPERKSSLTKYPNKELDESDKTGTVKRSPATTNKTSVAAMVHKEIDGDVSPDSGHNTSSSPIESTNSPNGIRSGSEFEFSESSDMEGAERIERIRVKTTINSSRIPSMCVITPPHSDDESVNSFNSLNFNKTTEKFALNLNEDFVDNSQKSCDSDKENQNIQTRIIKTTNKVQVINVNPQSGYATVETIEDINKNTKTIRAPSPSGGTLTINPSPVDKLACQPIIKASLLPLNNVFGRIKTNLVNLKQRRDSKSPNRNHDETINCGDYVTLADVQNNNCNNDDGGKVAPIKERQSGKIPRATEYVSLDELPCNEKHTTTTTTTTNQGNIDSLERKRRQGARVTLDAEGKVVYSSDSLRRRKETHTTFEPGPFVKTTSPVHSPLPSHRIPKQIRPVTSQDSNNHRPLSPQLGKLIIRATTGVTPSQPSEIIRVPSSIVAPNTRSLSPKPARGAYVHMQETGPTQDKDRVPSPSRDPGSEMYSNYRGITYQESPNRYNLENQYYHQIYQTLPAKKTQYFQTDQERSVTPDITRGLDRNRDPLLHQKLGIPVKIPEVNSFKPQDKVPLFGGREIYPNSNYQFAHISPPMKSTDDNNDSIRISPIDPRNNCGFQSSTPSSKTAINLETKLLSPKKSTMSNDELYAVIHKSKKKMNINDQLPISSPVLVETVKTKTPETGYIGDRSRSRLSWSPSKGEYIDFNSDIDKLSPPNEMRSRQSWACSDRKGASQTSRLDFKKLLLQKSNVLTGNTKKISAVEQLKLSKQQIVATPAQSPMNILELSGSPRSLVNRKFTNNQNSPRNNADKVKAPKLLSPRSQWRFVNPRTDVLSSTILEDCREDESPNNSMEKKKSEANISETKTDIKRSLFSTDSVKSTNTTNSNDITPYLSISQKLQARRAQFFENRPPTTLQNKQTEERKNKRTIPTLETAF